LFPKTGIGTVIHHAGSLAEYSGVCYKERMLQRTDFINKIKMLQRTQLNLDSFFKMWIVALQMTNLPQGSHTRWVGTMTPVLPPIC